MLLLAANLWFHAHGAAGGKVVACGPPSAVIAKAAQSHTGRVLGEFLDDRRT